MNSWYHLYGLALPVNLVETVLRGQVDGHIPALDHVEDHLTKLLVNGFAQLLILLQINYKNVK